MRHQAVQTIYLLIGHNWPHRVCTASPSTYSQNLRLRQAGEMLMEILFCRCSSVEKRLNSMLCRLADPMSAATVKRPCR